MQATTECRGNQVLLARAQQQVTSWTVSCSWHSVQLLQTPCDQLIQWNHRVAAGTLTMHSTMHAAGSLLKQASTAGACSAASGGLMQGLQHAQRTAVRKLVCQLAAVLGRV